MLMKRDTILEIKFNENSTLRLRKDKVIATVSSPDKGCLDIYVEGHTEPWHFNDIKGNTVEGLIGLVWGD